MKEDAIKDLETEAFPENVPRTLQEKEAFPGTGHPMAQEKDPFSQETALISRRVVETAGLIQRRNPFRITGEEIVPSRQRIILIMTVLSRFFLNPQRHQLSQQSFYQN
ncbi:MAG: hypothetical protein EXS63_04685 [Candidatus Omnitrophica bacterium]|nr:hypothetical protein [Candidatus Omnitrophota bacterium]